MLMKKQHIQELIDAINENMKENDYKVWYYETALEDGTKAVHAGHTCNPVFEPDDIHEVKFTNK